MRPSAWNRQSVLAAAAGFSLWWACAAGAAWCHLAWEVMRARGPSPGAGRELAYVALLAVVATSPLAAFATLGQWAKRVWPVWHGRVAPALACLVIALPAGTVATELASGDGVASRGWTTWVHLGSLTLLIAVGAGLAHWAFLSSKRLLWWLFGAGVSIASLFVWLKLDRAYGFLAPFAVGYSTAAAATLVHRVVEPLRAAVVARGAVWLVAMALALSARSAPLLQGRAAVLKSESSVRLFDQLVFSPGPAARAVEFTLPDPSAVRCPPQGTSADWEPLAIAPEQRRNVIIITLDSLRADVVEHTERGRPIMPNLLGFRRRAIVPERAYSPYPATLLAMGSALTGLAPRRILLAPSRPPTLFERARDHGLSCAALVPNDKWYTLDGFRRYILSGSDVTFHSGAGAAVTLAQQQLETWRKSGARGVLWVHLSDAHTPYRTYPGFEFGDSLRQRYLSGVALMDSKLGELLRYLEQTGRFEDSLVMVFADHGESLGERHYYGHHVFLDRWLTDVPFVLSYPGVATVRERAGLARGTVQLADVMMTALHFLGAQRPAESVNGVSLLSAIPPLSRISVGEAFSIRGETIYEHATKPVRDVNELLARAALVQRAAPRYEPKVALTDENYRIIVHRTTGVTELFRLNDASAVPRDLSEERPDVRRKMLAELVQWQRSVATQCLCALRASLGARPDR